MLAAVEVAGDVSGVVGATVGGSVDAGALIGSLVGATVVTTTAVVVPAGVDDFWHSGNRVIHCWHSVSFFAHRARQQYKLHGFSSSAIHASPPSAHSFARSAVTVDASHITASPASDRVPSVRIAFMASATALAVGGVDLLRVIARAVPSVALAPRRPGAPDWRCRGRASETFSLSSPSLRVSD